MVRVLDFRALGLWGCKGLGYRDLGRYSSIL